MRRKYKNTIWTDHALQRLRQRGISQGDAWAAFNRPDQSRQAETDDGWIFYRTYGKRRIEVVSKKLPDGDWLIISVWDKPVYGKRSTQGHWLWRLVKWLLGSWW